MENAKFDEAVERFTCGWCGYFATALHYEYGYGIVLLNHGKQDLYSYDHALAILSDGRLLDVLGTHDVWSDVQNEWGSDRMAPVVGFDLDMFKSTHIACEEFDAAIDHIRSPEFKHMYSPAGLGLITTAIAA